MSANELRPELPATYYLDNFTELLSQVEALYADLLSDEEQSFCRDFHRLSFPARCLYVRLLSRRGDWFRSERLSYQEIPDILSAATELEAQRFLAVVAPSSDMACTHPDEWLSLFTKPELLSVITEPGASGLRKAMLQDKVADMIQDGTLNPDSLTNEPLLCVYGAEEVEVFSLLFFGNLYQSLTDFVLRDLGIHSYVDYPLDRATRWCHSREQLEKHLVLYRLWPDEEALRDLDSVNLAALAQRLPDSGNDALLQRRSDRLRNRIGRQLERTGALDEALQVYAGSLHHPARERSLRILVGSDSNLSDTMAIELAREMAKAPWCEEEHQFLMSFVPRKLRSDTELCQSLEEKAHKPVTDTLILPADINRLELGVERATCLALAREYPGSDVLWCENLLIPGVFGLLFWEALFAPVEGAFFHPFQTRPADLYDENFDRRRRDILAQCWSKLGDRTLFRETVISGFEQNHGLANPFVHWGFLSTGLLEQALDVIPATHWEACFRFMFRDLRQHRAGLPDLIRFAADGSYELIEVKGPGDTLQKNQKGWLKAFARADIPARVLLVRDAPAG